MSARQISSSPTPGGEGWDEGEQLFAPQRHNLIRQKKFVVRPAPIPPQNLISHELDPDETDQKGVL